MNHSVQDLETVYNPSRETVDNANITEFMKTYGFDTYDDLKRYSRRNLDWFWDTVVKELNIEFTEPYSAVRDSTEGPEFTEWYVDGELNIASNVIDRYGKPNGRSPEAVACIWEAEDGERTKHTFSDIYSEANQVANALSNLGVSPGDRVGLFMPMVPEVISALYGCFKCGAVAVPIFSGFGVNATETRLSDAECTVVIAGDVAFRRGEILEIGKTLNEAVSKAETVDDVILLERGQTDIKWSVEGLHFWDSVVRDASKTFQTLSLPSEHPSMLLYSSGTTGKPKGIIQAHAGALIQPAKEIYFNFDYQEGDIFFWLSDIGWMMGPWTLIGNHVFGGTVLIYEGAPDYPTSDRLLDIVDYHGVTVFGISPTAIRSLRLEGDEWVDKCDLSSLRILGSTGEPWDVESWMWFFEKVGRGQLPIMNISGGTEIMGCFLAPSPLDSLKPTTLGGPGLGMAVDIVDGEGVSVNEPLKRGYLVSTASCPSMTQSLWSGDERYLHEYWSTWDGMWDHGDWAMVDQDGLWYLEGRADEALNIAGRKVGPAEIEGVLMDHDAVNQAAVVGVDDPTTGKAAVAFVIPEVNVEPDESLSEELNERVSRMHGPPFRPREILYVDALPKTQSGKILRRVMAKLYDDSDVGDLDSIQNPEALDAIRKIV